MKRINLLISFLTLFLLMSVTGCKEDIVEDVKVSLNKSVLTLDKGQTETLSASVSPATSKIDLKWTSSDNSVASVNSDGSVTGISAGEAVITVSADKAEATCKVTVRPTEVQEIVLDKTSLEMVVGEKVRLNATVLPEDADGVRLAWKSLNETVASVDGSGNVEALTAGKATVVVEAGGKIAQCMITVGLPVIHVESVKITEYAQTLEEGESFVFKAVVSPDDATDKSVVWESSNNEVMTIDQNGKAVAVEAGTVEISVKTNDGGKTDKCVVIVDPAYVPVDRVVINDIKEGDVLELKKGESVTLSATVYPEDATDKNIEWTVSDAKVLEVNASGKVTAVGGGTAKVTVTAKDGGKTAECTVNVVVPVESVTLDRNTVSMTEGDELTLVASVLPEDATDRNVTWSSDAENVVKVDGGKLTALEPGDAVITVRTADGGKTASCSVKVAKKIYPVTGVTLDKTAIELTVGDVFALTATVSPENATDKSLVWTSSDKEVAAVENGVVTTYKKGKTTISVKTVDGGFTAECEVSVMDKVFPVEGVTLDVAELELVKGTSYTLKHTVVPDNATNRNVKWSSSAGNIASVDDQGKVEALATGEAVITVTTEDGGKTAQCKVTVVPVKVESVSIVSVPEGNELTVGQTFLFKAEVSPADAADKSLIWSSSDDNVLSVDADGNATAVAKGEAVVTVTTVDGGKTDKCTVNVVPAVVKVEYVRITSYPSSQQMNVGDTFKFGATVYPENADDKTVTWTSSAPAVLSVDDEGNVKALAAGTADIIVTSTDGGKTAKMTVTVVVPKIPVTSVELLNIPSGNKMKVGDTFTFTARVLPENASDKGITWKSSDASVVSIDGSGVAKAIKAGSASISATSNDGGKVAKTLVNVVNAGSAIPVSSVTLTSENGSDELRHGKTLQLLTNYLPAGSYPGESKWYSSNEDLAVVDDNGLVKAVSFDYSQSHSHYVQNGYPVVTITHMADDISSVFKLKILPAVPEKIVVSNPPPSTMQLGQSWNMGTISILPVEAEQRVTIICSYDGEYGGTIENSQLNANKVGLMSVLITAMGEHAQTVNTGTSLNYYINVTPVEVTSLKMSRTSYTLAEGGRLDLSFTMSPANATYKQVTWSSSNTSVATVKDGSVTAVAPGKAVITVSSLNGVTASCEVTVTASTSAVKIGDYYYSDGTTSSDLLSGKTPVGIVFALIDPVGSDPAHLAKDHPGCRNGLVVGLKNYTSSVEMSSSSVDMEDVYEWASVNGYPDFGYPGEVILLANAAGYEFRQYYNNTYGYALTKAYNAFAKSKGVQCKVFADGGALDQQNSVELPSSTSGWYFPTYSEMQLLAESYAAVNASLSRISTADALLQGANDRYWTNTYYGRGDMSFTYSLSNGYFYKNMYGVLNMSPHSSDFKVRFIFAF